MVPHGVMTHGVMAHGVVAHEVLPAEIMADEIVGSSRKQREVREVREVRGSKQCQWLLRHPRNISLQEGHQSAGSMRPLTGAVLWHKSCLLHKKKPFWSTI